MLDAAIAHLRALRTAARLMPDGPAGPRALTVDLAQVRAFRAAATRLDRRLPAGAHREAAHGGLQDTVPRAALSALHARLEGVGPASWEAPALCQVWFRAADYVVPSADLAAFTLGALPRQPERAAALDALAAAVGEVLAGGSRPEREVLAELPGTLSRMGHEPGLSFGMLLRVACVTGRYRIRWDARTIALIPEEVPAMDAGEARLELVRRFLGWHGPATVAQFARWAGVSRQDAAETWALLAPELIPIGLDGRARHLLARDEGALVRSVPPTGVRLLPQGDPYLSLDRGLVDAAAASVPAPTRDDRGAPVTPRLVNSLGGRILVDGAIAGAWGRQQHHMALHLWSASVTDRDRVLAEAQGFAGPIGRPMRIRWLR
jgi:hypothetical protein